MYTGRVSVMSVVVSVRVPKWVKKVLEEHRVDIAELVRKTLIEEAKRLEEESFWKELDRVAKILSEKIDPYELARLIDEDRRSR